MDSGLTKITIAQKTGQEHLPTNNFQPTPKPIENKLIRILKVKTLGSEVDDILKPERSELDGLSPNDYHKRLNNIILDLQKLKDNEKRKILDGLYQDAIRVLQAETARNDLLNEFRMMLLQG